MRISTPYQYGTYSRDVAAAQERYLALQRQVSTGKRINSLGDDPLGMANALSLRQLQDGLAQYKKNLTSAKGQLGLQESTLAEMQTLTRRAYELAVQGANGATDEKGRQAMVSELNEIQKRLVDLGNVQGQNGQFLFGGQTTDAKPFTIVAGALTYNGDDFDRAVEAAPGETLIASIPARQTVEQTYAAIEQLKIDLQGSYTAISGVDIPALQASLDSINALRGAAGARLQSIDRWMSEHDRRGDEFAKAISDIEDVDITETIVHYQMAEMAYGAALQVASQGFRLSLLDFMQ